MQVTVIYCEFWWTNCAALCCTLKHVLEFWTFDRDFLCAAVTTIVTRVTCWCPLWRVALRGMYNSANNSQVNSGDLSCAVLKTTRRGGKCCCLHWRSFPHNFSNSKGRLQRWNCLNHQLYLFTQGRVFSYVLFFMFLCSTTGLLRVHSYYVAKQVSLISCDS